MKKYMQELSDYAKKPDAQNSQISVYLKYIANTFYSCLSVKENGNYGMLQAVVIQFQMTLHQMPQDIKSESSQKLSEIILNFLRQLDIIAENLENLDSGNIEIYKAISKLFLYVDKLFKLKESIVSYPMSGPFPM